jgi:hypothetical protein
MPPTILGSHTGKEAPLHICIADIESAAFRAWG